MSSLLSPESQALFPLDKIWDLVRLFRLECVQKSEPNLALLSIILGAVEHSLVHLDYTSAKPLRNLGLVGTEETADPVEDVDIDLSAEAVRPLLVALPVTLSKKKGGRGKGHRKSGRHQHSKVSVDFKQAKEVDEVVIDGPKSNGQSESCNGSEKQDLNPKDEGKDVDEVPLKGSKLRGDFPPLELEEVESLYWKFKEMLVTLVDLNEYRRDVKGTPKELVKHVSDVIWGYLSRSYKADTPHIQSLYTYILGKKLDSFGVALAVAAGCQILGLDDVHLALSEDHAWVVFGCEGQQSAEVTWHGKGIEDKRGQPVGVGDDVNSWLYLKGQAVHCTRHMEAAAIVTSINCNINANVNSSELIQIQQRLLWELHDAGNLDRYPMALSCLAELEEIKPTPDKKPCISLFQQAVLSARAYYNDMHILSYTNYAGYLYRQQDYKSALKYWAEAARVVQKYSRSKNDEEIYREFLEISTDYLMNMMKQSSTGFSAHSIMRDPCSFAQVLRFFDGICMWEERSPAPIVHITWAKAWVSAIGKFDYTIRRMVQITLGNTNGEGKENSKLRIQPNPYDENEKDSGIDEDEIPSSAVTLHSKKIQQLKDLLKRDKYNPSAMTLLLTAQSATSNSVTISNEAVDSGSGRPRRERLSLNVDSSKDRGMKDETLEPPQRKRAKLEVGVVNQPA